MLESIRQNLNSLSEKWFQWMSIHLIETLLLLGIIFVVWLLIHRRSAPQYGVLLFLLVPLKLLFPFSIAAPQSMAKYAPSAWVQSRFEIESDSVTPKITSDLEALELATATLVSPAEVDYFEPGMVLPIMDGVVETERKPPTTDFLDSGFSISGFSVAFLVWMIVAFALFCRFVVSQCRFSFHVLQCKKQRSKDLSIDMLALCRRVGLRREIPILHSDQISCPVVWGPFRPVILIPVGYEKSFRNDQLQWALLHELAHIKRFDLLFVLLQRLVTILYWFNPAVWIANRWIDHLREFACDDLASLAMDASPVQSGQAFLEMIRFSSTTKMRPVETLGVFGRNVGVTHSSIGMRLNRLLDESRMIRTKVGRFSFAGLAIFAIAVLPSLNAMNSDVDDNSLEIAVVDSEQNSAGNDQLHLYSDLEFAAAFDGKLLSKNAKTTQAATEENGTKVPATRPASLTSFEYGGIVKDEFGNPISGVTVNSYANLAIPSHAVLPGVTKTNELGEWSLVDIKNRRTVEFIHPNYETVLVDLLDGKFNVDDKSKPLAEMKLNKGIPLTGRILDSANSPIAEARILVRTNRRFNRQTAKNLPEKCASTLETTSDANGNYRLGGCYSGKARMVVAAKEYALEMDTIDIQNGMAQLDIKLEPSKKLTLRVVDENNRPVPNANIMLSSWRDVRQLMGVFYPMNAKTDQNGVWNWDEAPNDEFDVMIRGSSNLMHRISLKMAGGNEYTTQLRYRQNLNGLVVDSETGQPIRTFNLIPGTIDANQNKKLNWNRRRLFNRGEYQYSQTKEADKFFLRVESGGYLPTETRIYDSNENNVQINVELKPTNRDTVVLLPNKKPANGAKVRLQSSGGPHYWVIDGALPDPKAGSVSPEVKIADKDGRVKFSPEKLNHVLHSFKNDGRITVTHPEGFACLMICDEGARGVDDAAPAKFFPRLPKSITLTPWAKVQGVMRQGDKVLANEFVDIGGKIDRNFGDFISEFDFHSTTVTNEKGEFLFERVLPGKCRIGNRLELQDPKNLKPRITIGIETKSGETLSCVVGGPGTTVRGQLIKPKNDDKAFYSQVFILPDLDLVWRIKPKGLVDGTRQMERWVKQWEQTEAGKRYQQYANARHLRPVFRVNADEQGEFLVTDVPPGNYVVRVGDYHDYCTGFNSQFWPELVSGDLRFSIEETDDPAEEIDLGKIQLKPRTPRSHVVSEIAVPAVPQSDKSKPEARKAR